jgi:lipopolysaccharide transport system ATP-binding protein
MSDVVIRAEGLGKKYLIGHETKSGSYVALRDVISRTARNALRKARDLAHGRPIVEGDQLEEVWALRDVNFEVRRGEVVGIVGRNGAGKSTLLKVLSRITEPSEGRVTVTGRVASLLEVGTGFHPELTGRQNIYLNGAILGMTRAEIRGKFDEIVAFAEVDRFLDTPVKRYSSGMHVRLAFSVAAHLEPEVLVVDEVLAVGDAEFRKRCLGKMRSISRSEGRTVLFVSHDMSAIQGLCGRGLLIRQGRIAVDASASACVAAYLGESISGGDRFTREAQQSGVPTIVRGCIDAIGDPDSICVDCWVSTAASATVSLDLRLSDLSGYAVGFGSLGTFGPKNLIALSPGENRISFKLPAGHLAAGSYSISLDLTIPDMAHLDRLESCLQFDIARAPAEGRTRVLQQSWGYGSYELPMVRRSVDGGGREGAES